MSPAVKNAIMGVVVVVLIVGAVFIYKKRSSGTSYTDDPNLVTHWMDEETGEHFDLTPAKYQDWLKSPDKLKRGPDVPQGLIVFLNPNTGKFNVVRAEVDPLTKDWFILSNSKGEPQPPPEKIKKARDDMMKGKK